MTEHDERCIRQLLPGARPLFRSLLELMAAAGHPVTFAQAGRDEAEQAADVARGASATSKSWHLVGCGGDLIFVVAGKRTYKGPWDLLGATAEALGFRWGGRWKKPHDLTHVEHHLGMTWIEARDLHQRLVAAGEVDPPERRP